MAKVPSKFKDHDAPDESVNSILAGYFDAAAALLSPPGGSFSSP